MADPIQFNVPTDEELYGPSKPAAQPATDANPLVSFFQGIGGFGGGLVRGAQQSAAGVGETLGTMSGNPGLVDWAKSTSQDVARSEPDLTNRPIRQFFNATAEGIGGMAAPVAAGIVAASAAPEAVAGATIAEVAAAAAGKSLAGTIAGATATLPIAFGSSKMEAIARGADDDTANRIGMESAVLNAGAFALPMHQLLQGGSLVSNILRNAGVNAVAGGALSYGQEEIMKHNDIQSLPDGQEFNNTLYATMVGGATGVIFGAFAPHEMVGKAEQIWDGHIAPKVREQIAAEYVAKGMSKEDADAKAIDDVEKSRESGIKDLTSWIVKGNFNKDKMVEGNYELVKKDVAERASGTYYYTDRSQGGATSEIENIIPTLTKDESFRTSRIINTALTEVSLDEKGNVKQDENGRPIFKQTTTDKIPVPFLHLLTNEIATKLRGRPDEDSTVVDMDLVKQLQERKLDAMDPNLIVYLGAHAGEPSDTGKIFMPSMGVRTIKEAASISAHPQSVIDAEKIKVVHSGDKEAADATWNLFHQSVQDFRKATIDTAIPADETQRLPDDTTLTRFDPDQLQFNYNAPSEENPPTPEQMEENAHLPIEITPEEPQPVETPKVETNQEQLDRLKAKATLIAMINAKEESRTFEQQPSDENGGLGHSMLQEAISNVTGEGEHDDNVDLSYSDEDKALSKEERENAELGHPLARNFFNTLSDYTKAAIDLIHGAYETVLEKKTFSLNKLIEGAEKKDSGRTPNAVKIASIETMLRNINQELALRKKIDGHDHNAHLVDSDRIEWIKTQMSRGASQEHAEKAYDAMIAQPHAGFDPSQMIADEGFEGSGPGHESQDDIGMNLQMDKGQKINANDLFSSPEERLAKERERESFVKSMTSEPEKKKFEIIPPTKRQQAEALWERMKNPKTTLVKMPDGSYVESTNDRVNPPTVGLKYKPEGEELERAGQPLSSGKKNPYVSVSIEDLEHQSKQLQKQLEAVQKMEANRVKGALRYSEKTLQELEGKYDAIADKIIPGSAEADDIAGHGRYLTTAGITYGEALDTLKEHYNNLMNEQKGEMKETFLDEDKTHSVFDDIESEFGPGMFDDPTAFQTIGLLAERDKQGRRSEDVVYKKEVNQEAAEGKPVRQIKIQSMIISGTDVRTGEEVKNAPVDGTFRLTYDPDKKIVEIKDGHHIAIDNSRGQWTEMLSQALKRDPDAFKITTISPVVNVGVEKLSQLTESGRAKVEEKPIAAKATPEEKRLYNSIRKIPDWYQFNLLNFPEVKAMIEANTKHMSQSANADAARKIVQMENDKASMVHADMIAKLTPSMGEEIKTKELEANAKPENVRSFPLKTAFKLAEMTGNRQRFLEAAMAHYGNKGFEDKFTVKPPADVVHSIVEGLKQDKQTLDLIRHIATDNLTPAAKVQWEMATDLARKTNPEAKRSDIQRAYKLIGAIQSRASEENLPDGQKSFIGNEQQFTRTGQPGAPDEWRQRDNFIRGYLNIMKQAGLPIPENLDRRPELAYTNILKQLTGDRGYNHMMWMKSEVEDAAFQSMVKAGVFDDTGIEVSRVHGFSPRIHEMKGLQREKAKGQAIGGDPTHSASILHRDALDFDDFVGRSMSQGLEVVETYADALHQYTTQSLSKAMQYRTLNWLRMFKIPNSKDLKLSKETPEIRSYIDNLNYVEYESSPNITALSNLTGMTKNDILRDLGYFNKKDAEGLVGWDKFSFEKPFMQASLGDTLDNLYPHSMWQGEGVSAFSKIANIPKMMLVTLSPFQHGLLFASSVMVNSGWKLPVVLSRFAIEGARTVANMPFAAIDAAKGQVQTHDIFGREMEPGYKGMENLSKFLPHGMGAGMWGSMTDGLFQDSKAMNYLIPEMMTGAQAKEANIHSILGANKIVFGHFLMREIYNVTNQRYNQFRTMLGKDGQPLMTDEEAARRAVTLINSTSGVVHASSFGKTGPLWSLLTFARGLTIAPLRVISGMTEPTLRKIYGSDSPKYKIDPISGFLNPITMGDVSPRDADFLQAYYAQHLAKVIGLRVLAAGLVQYGLSFLDDDKKDAYGQEGHDPMNKKRFIFNNPEGFRMGVRTPWQDINGRQVMMNPTFLREGAQLVDMTGLGSRYHFPQSTVNWIKNRINVWEGLIYGAVDGVDLGTGQLIPGKGTNEYADEVGKWMASKVVPLSIGITKQEKEMRIPNDTAENINKVGALYGTTPMSAPAGWYPGYEDAKRAEKEIQLKQLQAKESVKEMTEQEVRSKQLTAFFTTKMRQTEADKKNPAKAMMENMKLGRKALMEQERQKQLQEAQTEGVMQ